MAGASLADLKEGRLSVLDIDLMYQAKLEEMYLVMRPQLDEMASKISAKSLAEVMEKAPLPDDPVAAAKEEKRRAEDKRLEEIGRPYKAKLVQQLHARFHNDIRRARHVRRYGWPGEEGRVKPIAGVSQAIAAEVLGLAKAEKLAAFTEFWKQVTGDEYARLEVTAGVQKGDG